MTECPIHVCLGKTCRMHLVFSRQKYSIILEKWPGMNHSSFYIYILKCFSKHSGMLKYSKFASQILINRNFLNTFQIYFEIVIKNTLIESLLRRSIFSFAFKIKRKFLSYHYINNLLFFIFEVLRLLNSSLFHIFQFL